MGRRNGEAQKLSIPRLACYRSWLEIETKLRQPGSQMAARVSRQHAAVVGPDLLPDMSHLA